jgi:hypothetical protein
MCRISKGRFYQIGGIRRILPNIKKVPKNTYFLAPHPGKIRIFNKRNDGTIAKTYQLTGKAGKRA